MTLDEPSRMNREPVTTVGYAAAAAVAVSTLLALVPTIRPRWSHVAAAAAVAGSQAALVVAAAHVARERAWAPATVDGIIAAEAVIAEAQASPPISAYADGSNVHPYPGGQS